MILGKKRSTLLNTMHTEPTTNNQALLPHAYNDIRYILTFDVFFVVVVAVA